ncbi:MAG: site-specific integrase [Elusimicrobiota bacterium]|nr:site-specific integrase [Endomicrobiia bacterium]MDW8165155.1 site-specific integrase [Elusimicrobiota bacterium]
MGRDNLVNYLKIEGKSEGTIQTYENSIKELLSKSEINEDDIRKFIFSLAKYKPATRIVKLSALKKFLKANNININIELPKIKMDDNRRKYKEIEINKETINDNEKMIAIILMLGYGLRVSEVINLEWNDIDFEKNIFKIKGKGGNYYFFHLNEKLKELLESVENKDGKVIKMTRQALWYFLKRKFNTFPHELRANFITKVGKRNFTEAVKLARHKNPQTTMRYIIEKIEEQKETIDELVNSLLNKNT